MQITHLSLTNFRNYARLEMPFPAGMILLYGNNAQGKTSLLEAIYYLATSRSMYSTSDRQLINWLAQDEPLPYARLVAECRTNEGIRRVEVTLVLENGKFKKETRINGLPRRVSDILGQIRVVMFLPQDLALIEGPPSGRRRYLNITLCQTNADYCHALAQYEKVLTQRNALLKHLQEQQYRGRKPDLTQLIYWDEQLADHGALLIAGRYRLVRELEDIAKGIHSDLSGADEHLRLAYEPGFDASTTGNGQLAFDAGLLGAAALPRLSRTEIAERFREVLRMRQREDLARGLTTIGPQRDEIRFMVNGYDLGLYGSRGQDRTAVMAVKLAELEWMKRQTGEAPILLLDEVAAELDPDRRSYLMARIGEVSQVIMTTAEPELLADFPLTLAARWHVQAGTIQVDREGSPKN
jgi:DNA replication and repair protein RecF